MTSREIGKLIGYSQSHVNRLLRMYGLVRNQEQRKASYLGAKPKPIESRFWRNVKVGPASECWPWLRAVNAQGYGTVWYNRMSRPASRVSYMLHHGLSELPPPELHVCHKCDNRTCCNPNHLFLGTAKDNQQDCVAKGRKPIGEKNGRCRISSDVVRQIRSRYKRRSKTDGNAALAKEFGISPTWLSVIVRRRYRVLV